MNANGVGATLRGRPDDSRHIGLPVRDDVREHAIIFVCACAALAFGALAALGAEQAVATISVAFAFCVAALILPRAWIALALAAWIPVQFYFPFAGTLSLRGAQVFVGIVALRVLIGRVLEREWRSLRSLPWLIPAALFLGAALIAAISAPNRYEALKGIYIWLPIFATAFVVSEIVQSERLVKRIAIILISVGMGEAVLGLIQSALDLPRVVSILQLPINALVFQPNLLRERLSDLSFNWISNGRILPFGTFINGIDYAIFVAAILSLVLALLLDNGRLIATRRAGWLALLISAFLLGGAMLQTFRGSGLLALAGGLSAIAILLFPRVSPRTLAKGALVLVGALVLAVPLYGDLAYRALFLIQRETGAIVTSGRLAIWAQLLTYLPQRWLFGWGMGNSVLLVGPQPSMNGGAFVYYFSPSESAYVAALVETGIVGFAALMLFIGVILRRAYRCAQSARAPGLLIGVCAALVAILFGSLTVDGLTTDQNGMLLGVLIGLIFSGANDAHLYKALDRCERLNRKSETGNRTPASE